MFLGIGSGAVGDPGSVQLNLRLVVNTNSVENLILRGFDGDDTFNLVPALSASVYQTINIDGGGGTGDRVNLIGTAGHDAVTVSGQTVSMTTGVQTHL